MGTRQERFFRDLLVVVDAGVIVLAFVMSYVIRGVPRGGLQEMPPLANHAPLLGIILPVWLFFLRRFRTYEFPSLQSFSKLFYAIASTQGMSSLVLFSTILLVRAWGVSRLFLLTFMIVSGVMLIIERQIVRVLMTANRGWRVLERRRTVIVANSTERAARLAEILSSLPFGRHEILGFLSLDGYSETSIAGKPVLGQVRDVEGILRSHAIDEIVAAGPSHGSPELAAAASVCLERGVTYRAWIDLPSPYDARPYVERIGDRSFLLSLETAPLDPFLLSLKRLLDVAGALVGLVVMAVVHFWYGRQLAHESPGPLYFQQLRVGQNGRPFILYKFRTMCLDAEERLNELKAHNQMNGSIFKMREDPRLLPIARGLRSRHLDELPQFWNVLRGDMSLVGTRPPTVDEVAMYLPHHFRRLSMKPGITGLWQLEGNERVANFEDVVRLDRQYIDNWSLWLDCRILLKTIMKVARRDGW